MSDEPTIILGIDPGTTIMGYGVIRAWSRNRVELLEMGALHLSKVKDHAAKLKRIHERCAGLIEAHTPDHFAVEAPFFGKNVQSMLKLGRAQGVALASVNNLCFTWLGFVCAACPACWPLQQKDPTYEATHWSVEEVASSEGRRNGAATVMDSEPLRARVQTRPY